MKGKKFSAITMKSQSGWAILYGEISRVVPSIIIYFNFTV